MRLGFSVGIVGAIAAFAGASQAGTVVGRLELPAPPERGPVIAKGFLDRTENPLADTRKVNLAPYFVVALDGEVKPEAAPAEVTWELVGESFARPVIAVPVGAQVVIKNTTKISRTIGAIEDPKLFAGPLHPAGTKSFRATQPAIYTIGDAGAPHLRGKVVVVATTHVANLDDSGRFEMANVAEGSYKLRVFYYDPGGEAHGTKSDWLPFTTDVTVSARAKTEVNAKLPVDLSPRPAPGKQ